MAWKRVTIHIAYDELGDIIRNTLEYLRPNFDGEIKAIDFDLLLRFRTFLYDRSRFTDAFYQERFPTVCSSDSSKFDHDGCFYSLDQNNTLSACILYNTEKSVTLAEHESFSWDFRNIKRGRYKGWNRYWYKNEVDHFLSHLIIHYINESETKKECTFYEAGLVLLWQDLESMGRISPAPVLTSKKD